MHTQSGSSLPLPAQHAAKLGMGLHIKTIYFQEYNLS